MEFWGKKTKELKKKVTSCQNYLHLMMIPFIEFLKKFPKENIFYLVRYILEQFSLF